MRQMSMPKPTPIASQKVDQGRFADADDMSATMCEEVDGKPMTTMRPSTRTAHKGAFADDPNSLTIHQHLNQDSGVSIPKEGIAAS